MFTKGIWSLACLAGTAAVLGGCVAEGPLSVVPGQGKSAADLQRDDAACRSAPAAAPSASVTTPTPSAPAGNYYQCMAARGELVIANRTVAYPAYAAYPYGYPYPYPYAFGYPYGYPYYGYPYSAAYLGPYVGLGIGLGFGGFHGDHGWRGGFHGDHGWRGGDRGFHGGGGGFRGRGGGFRR